MSIITLIGVDPGLVDTGVVAIHINPADLTWLVRSEAIHADQVEVNGKWEPDLDKIVRETVQTVRAFEQGETHEFIEQYRDRGTSFVQHGKMRRLENLLNKELPSARLLDNTGVKKVVTPQLAQRLNVWSFPTTNHRDLQAAARIAVYGGLKDKAINRVLYNLVTKN